MQKKLHSLLFILVLGVLVIEVYLVWSRILAVGESWLPLILAGAGVVALLVREDRNFAMVLGAFLASFSIAMSSLSWGEFRILLPGLAGRGVDFLWTALLLAMPFLFVHLALLFPVRSQLLSRRPGLARGLYAAPLLLAILGQFDELVWLVDPFVLLFPLGLLCGTAIFAGQYFFHLTLAEKLRLRLVLIGCVAGIIPRLLFLMARGVLPQEANQFSLILLPLFPLCLLLASQRRSLGEIDPAYQRLFGWLVTLSGWIAVSFLGFVLAKLLVPDLSSWIQLSGSVALGLLLVGPLGRAAVSYLTEQHTTRNDRRVRVVPFTPIRPNPFIVGNPVRESPMFFGRRAEFQFIRSTLRNQTSGCTIVLCGDRRTGKTSILLQILEGRLGPGFRPVFLDMQGMVAADDREFLNLVKQECTRSLPEGPEPGELPQSSPYPRFTEFMQQLAARLGESRLLLLIDEYELIEERLRSGRLSPEMPRFLNSLLEHVPGLSMILTGSQGFLGRPAWNDLLGKSFFREISFLDDDDAEALLREPLAGRVEFQGDSLSRLLRLSAGHPYFTQLLGQNLVDSLNESRRALVTARRVEQVLERILEHPPPHLVYLWEELDLEQQLVLAGLAGLISTPVQFANWKRVRRVLQSVADSRAQDIDETRVRILLEDLRRRSLVDRDQQRYRFKMDLLRLWVAGEHSVWSVLGRARRETG